MPLPPGLQCLWRGSNLAGMTASQESSVDRVPSGLSRRQFLRATGMAATAAPFLISCRTTNSTSNSPAKPVARAGKLNHASIGVGGMGAVDLQNFLQHPRLQIVAL